MKPNKSIIHNALLLGVFAIVTTFAISATWLLTKDRIAIAENKAKQKALLELVPRTQHSNNMLEDTLALTSADTLLGLTTDSILYRARNNSGEVIAVILPSHTPDGYSGGIDLLIGVRRDLTLAGVRVIRHRETPGLGDKIERRKSNWIEQFIGKSLQQPPTPRWQVKKDGGDFDQLTGATITPRAVVNATARALHYARNHYADLFDTDKPTAGGPTP